MNIINRIESFVSFVASGDIEQVSKILSEQPSVIGDKYGSYGGSPLHYAASEGQVAIAKLLLDKGADANAVNKGSGTPLHAASTNGHFDIVTLLLQFGAQVNAKNDYGGTPLHHASACGHLGIVRLLIEHGAELNAKDIYNETPVLFAASNARVEVVEFLVTQGCDLYAKSEESNSAWDVIKRERASSVCSAGSASLYNDEKFDRIARLCNWVERRDYLMLVAGTTKGAAGTSAEFRSHGPMGQYLFKIDVMQDVCRFLQHLDEEEDSTDASDHWQQQAGGDGYGFDDGDGDYYSPEDGDEDDGVFI